DPRFSSSPPRRQGRPFRCHVLPSRTGPRRRRPARADPGTGRSTPVRASSWHASRLFLGDPPWTVSRIVSHAGGRLQLPSGLVGPFDVARLPALVDRGLGRRIRPENGEVSLARNSG